MANLRTWRAKHKLTQAATAAMLGMKPNGIRDAEQRENDRKITELACKFLDLMMAPTTDLAAYKLRKMRRDWYK